MTTDSPTFAQSVDPDRPHTLLTENTRFSGSLLYRYDDTGETVSVPNIWYNQTFDARVAYVRYEAQMQDAHAARYENNPPYNITQAAAKDIARRHRERADRIRAEAARMEAAGEAAYPVKASRLQLDYGELVR